LSLNSIEVTGQAEAEEELIMVLSQAYLEWEQQTEQRGRQEGEQTGALREAQALILRLLSRRIGNISEEMRSQVEALSIVQLEALGEALLDFSEDGDLVRWLQDNNG
jgi:predicted transposase YdaD